KFIKLNSIPLSVVREPEDFPQIQKSDLLIDALFGTGISRALTGVTTRLVQYMNQSGAPILSIDMPSGLKTEENDGSPSDAIIKARYTLTFQFPKLSFFFSENDNFVGEWIIRDIHLAQSALDEQETPYYYTDIQ